MHVSLVWWPLAVFYLIAAVFRECRLPWASHDTDVQCLAVVVAPFLPPANGVGDTPPLPYYLCVASFAHFEDAR